MALPLETTVITRGVMRLLHHRGYAGTVEFDLPNGRRADIFAVDGAGRIHIVEIKVSLEDFLRDAKWPEYGAYCDAFSFAVPAGFPLDRLPAETGLIVADRYGGEVLVEPPASRLAAATRKSLLVEFGRVAARRLARSLDPTIDEPV